MTNKTPSDKAMEWIAESDYIARVAVVRGAVPEMNYSAATFARYCQIQSNAARKAGFTMIADRIANHGKHEENVAAHTPCPPECPTCGGAS